MKGLATALLCFAASVPTPCWAFQVSSSDKGVHSIARSFSHSSSKTTQLFAVDVSEAAPRDYNTFAAWGNQYGLQTENMQLGEQFNEWGGVAINNAQAGSRVLFVPGQLRLTSSRIRQEEFPQLENAIKQYFDATNSNGQTNLGCQFYLFLKILKEYDQGEQSPYYPWLNALPRNFHTSITFKPYCIECLPPFVAFLAKQDRSNYELFMEVVNTLDIPQISPQTKQNLDVTKWAFNVVFTRARAAFEEAEIIPMADMLNHNANPNVEVQYDNDGNVHVVALRNIQSGEPLFKSYGQITNPSRFLSTYGFFDASSPATYCKLMAGKTLTPELKNMGFVYDRMVFYHETGDIAPEVWDVMLYIILGDNDRNLQQQFYEAHMRGDAQTKANFHNQYRGITADALLNHVDDMFRELGKCADKIRANPDPNNKNLPMIMYHNDFVRETFIKVRQNLENIKSQG